MYGDSPYTQGRRVALALLCQFKGFTGHHCHKLCRGNKTHPAGRIYLPPLSFQLSPHSLPAQAAIVSVCNQTWPSFPSSCLHIWSTRTHLWPSNAHDVVLGESHVAAFNVWQQYPMSGGSPGDPHGWLDKCPTMSVHCGGDKGTLAAGSLMGLIS